MTGRSLLNALCLTAGMALFVAAAPAHPQSASATPNQNSLVIYDASKEIKIQGNIEKIETAKTGVTGTHLMLNTPAGMVDVHVGVGPASTAVRLGLSPGQSVEIIGMMATIGGSQIFLARTLTTGETTITLRSTRGIPLRAAMPPKNAAASPKGGL
jgi:hypothetical protein